MYKKSNSNLFMKYKTQHSAMTLSTSSTGTRTVALQLLPVKVFYLTMFVMYFFISIVYSLYLRFGIYNRIPNQ